MIKKLTNLDTILPTEDIFDWENVDIKDLSLETLLEMPTSFKHQVGSIKFVISNDINLQPDINFNENYKFFFVGRQENFQDIIYKDHQRDLEWFSLSYFLKTLEKKYSFIKKEILKKNSLSEEDQASLLKSKKILSNIEIAKKYLGNASSAWIAEKFFFPEYIRQFSKAL